MYLFAFTNVVYANPTSDANLLLGNYNGFQRNGYSSMEMDISIKKDTSNRIIFNVTLQDFHHTFSESMDYMTIFDESNANFTLYPFEQYKNKSDFTGIEATYIGLFHDNQIYGLQRSKYAVEANNYFEENFFFPKKVTEPYVELYGSDFSWSNGIHNKVFDAKTNGCTLDNLSFKLYAYDNQTSSLSISFDASKNNSLYTYAITLPKDLKTVYTVCPNKIDGIKAKSTTFIKYVASKLPGDFLGTYEYVSVEESANLQKQFSSSLLKEIQLDSLLGRTNRSHETYSGTFISNAQPELRFYFDIPVDELLETLSQKKLSFYIGGNPENEVLVESFQPVEKQDAYLPFLEKGHLTDLPITDDDFLEYLELASGKLETPILTVRDYLYKGEKSKLSLIQNSKLRAISIQSSNDLLLFGFNHKNEECLPKIH